MNKKSLLTLALMASFSVALVGCGDKPKKVERKPVAVAVMPAQATDTYRWIETYGQTEGAQEIEVRAQVGGILRQLNFKEGSFVKKGDTLFELEKEPYEAALAQAKAQTAQAQTTLDQTLRDWRRAQKLIKADAISQQEFDKAKNDYLNAKSSLMSAKAKQTSAQLDLDRSRVPAPVDGVAGRAEVNVGSLVSANSTLLTKITQPDTLRVVFTISDRYLQTAELALNNPVQIFVNGSKEPIEAKLDYIGQQVDAKQGALRLRAEVPKTDKLWSGQYVEVRVMVGHLKNIFKVPQGVIRQRADGTYSVYVNDKGTVKEKPVTLAHWEGRDWVVTGGLTAGDEVIVDNLLRLRDRMKITVKGQKQ